MSNDNTVPAAMADQADLMLGKRTLADAQPGGRVRLGDQAALKRLHAHLTAYPPPCNPEDVAVLGAALSAQPSPGVQTAHCPVKHCDMTYARVPADGRCHACGASVQPSPGGQDALAEAARRVLDTQAVGNG
ncbi:hypothetical protein HGQ62_01805 [Stenotrophomonas maltophilia]|nr:hypothetical protein [Stenotrophomonas maltophilia]NMT71770.1 hypothetical protein [Stenotrophomonas maltophilia]